jgi:excisionase family DNA binding protein
LIKWGEQVVGNAKRVTMAHDTEVLNAHEAAAFFGVYVETIRRLARRGEIPSFKMGKDWRFRKDAILRWSEEQHRSLKPGFVLIVDDDEKICRALCRIVTGLGCRALSVVDGYAGLDVVRREKPDLILLDLAMPRMNGPQFLEELRRANANIPVVIVTGYPEGELMAEAMKYGPLLLLPKPFEAAQVERAVNMVVGMRAPTNVRTEPEALAP